MSEEIKEILYYFEKYNFEDTMIDGKETKLLYDYITNLQNELQQKEKEIERLNKELEFEKLKNKEVREYIENYNIGMPYDHFVKKENLLEILDKENI